MSSAFTILILQLAGIAAVGAAAKSDFVERIIPNRVSLGLVVIGLLLQLVAAPARIWISLSGAIGLLFALGMLARFAIIGGGDAKLITASSILVPTAGLFRLILAIAIAGGVLGGIYFAARFFLVRHEPGFGAAVNRNAPRSLLDREAAKIVSGEGMPYAVAIFAGVTFSVIREVLRCSYATSCSL